MRAIDNTMRANDQAPMAFRRRSFFRSLIVLAAGTPILGRILGGPFNGNQEGSRGNAPGRITVQPHPAAVPRNSKGLTPNE